MSWPHQQRPGWKDWSIWQRFLKKAVLYRGLRLQAPLGNWLRVEDDWEWYFSPSLECLFRSHQGQWWSFSKLYRRDRLPTFLASGNPTTPPKDLERATIYTTKNRIMCSGHSPILKESICNFNSFLEYLLALEPSERWCFDYLTLSDDGSTMVRAIRQGDAIAISDGSFQDQFGTAAWVIEGARPTGRIVGDVTVPGTAKDQSAY
jgi:hypothetical protein